LYVDEPPVELITPVAGLTWSSLDQLIMYDHKVSHDHLYYKVSTHHLMVIHYKSSVDSIVWI